MIELMPGAFGLVFGCVMGALWGSFANVCIYRWPPSKEFPTGRSCAFPPSHCFSCSNNIKWYDNLPLISWLWLKGQCRFCKTSFSSRYLWVELACLILFGLMHVIAFSYKPAAMSQNAALLHYVFLCTFVFILVVIAFIDIDHQLVLDIVTYPWIPIFFMLGCLTYSVSAESRVLGVLIGYGSMRSIDILWEKILKRGPGMGGGDAKLLAMIGAFLGWQALPITVFAGCIFGILQALPAAVRKGEEDFLQRKLPFGPFLAMGALTYVCLIAIKPPLPEFLSAIELFYYSDWMKLYDPLFFSL